MNSSPFTISDNLNFNVTRFNPGFRFHNHVVSFRATDQKAGDGRLNGVVDPFDKDFNFATKATANQRALLGNVDKDFILNRGLVVTSWERERADSSNFSRDWSFW